MNPRDFLKPEEIVRLRELNDDLVALRKVRAGLNAEVARIHARTIKRRDAAELRRRREADARALDGGWAEIREARA